jgi:hypothetical protein
MRFFSRVKAMKARADEHLDAFCDKHEKAVGTATAIAGIGMVAGGLVTGQVSAAGTVAPIYGGMTLVDMLMFGIGAVALLAGIFMRNLYALVIGAVLFIGGAVAYGMGY